MRIERFAAVLLLASSATSAFAACPTAKSTVFACTTTKGKAVEVCDAGKTIQYSFGPKGGKPELALNVPRAAASTSQWHGIGSTMYYSVTVPNGKTTYEVSNAIDRNSGHQSAGIDVSVAGKPVARVECKVNTVVDNIEGIDLRSSD